MQKLPKFERDSSYRRRGGSAEWLLVMCGVCKESLGLYQKDGPGNLLRLYLDRITNLDGTRPFKHIDYSALRPLSCLACKNTIAVPMLYQKDDRPRTALRLVESGVDKKTISPYTMIDLSNIDANNTMQSIVATAINEA